MCILNYISQPQMETRGVDSVRSPVTTLRAADPAARHEAFVDAVTRSFGRAFGVDLHAQAQNEDAILGGDASRRAYVEKGVQEMKVGRAVPPTSLSPHLTHDSSSLGSGRMAKHQNLAYRFTAHSLGAALCVSPMPFRCTR